MESVIYFAGGCFWGVEHFFKGVDGVLATMPGYANGSVSNPAYEQVYTDTTGHAETVRVSYDPSRVSLERLVRLFFAIIDPLSLNRQGHDEGTRYRTGVYYASEDERRVIEPVFRAVSARLGAPLAVELEPLRSFWSAEERHRDYLDNNAGGYCHLPLKAFRYLRLYQDVELLLGDEPDPVARQAEAAALIAERMRFFWTGFYRVAGDTLVLGPFQGPAACLRIARGRGVCGAAWERARTVVVPDVEAFPGHIACSSLSRSEIVVPLIRDGAVTAVLDIDSTEPATFDEVDAVWLEMIAELV
ncbi:MAG: peptide-methionine (S)-S-oxide reductase MsrA [Bacteroidales bacterium]|nr:peptide-methionine (S)-S-oxide reductase MsrA [Bacteroidales bacterium]